MQTILDNIGYIVIVVLLLGHEISIRSIRKELDECKKKGKKVKNLLTMPYE